MVNGYGTIQRGDDRPAKLPGGCIFGFYKTTVYFTFYVGLYVAFLSCGALMFRMLETASETAVKLRVESTIANFLRTYPNVSEQALEHLIKEVVAASGKGVVPSKNATDTESNWNFGQSFFFAGTVVTTIGYGRVTPLSRAGKIFCMVYGTVGIPLTLVLLSALVARLLVPTVGLLGWLNAKLGPCWRPLNIRLLHLVVVVITLVVVFLLIPSGIFSKIEPTWDFLDAFYYCFISLTTIGLGDYIPGDAPDQAYKSLYKIATTGFLYLGLTFVMLTLAVFYDIPQLNLGMFFTEEKTEQTPLLLSVVTMERRKSVQRKKRDRTISEPLILP